MEKCLGCGATEKYLWNYPWHHVHIRKMVQQTRNFRFVTLDTFEVLVTLKCPEKVESMQHRGCAPLRSHVVPVDTLLKFDKFFSLLLKPSLRRTTGLKTEHLNIFFISPTDKQKKPIQTKYRMPLFNWDALKLDQVEGTIFSELDDQHVLQVWSVCDLFNWSFSQWKEDKSFLFFLSKNRSEFEYNLNIRHFIFLHSTLLLCCGSNWPTDIIAVLQTQKSEELTPLRLIFFFKLVNTSETLARLGSISSRTFLSYKKVFHHHKLIKNYKFGWKYFSCEKQSWDSN